VRNALLVIDLDESMDKDTISPFTLHITYTDHTRKLCLRHMSSFPFEIIIRSNINIGSDMGNGLA